MARAMITGAALFVLGGATGFWIAWQVWRERFASLEFRQAFDKPGP